MITASYPLATPIRSRRILRVTLWVVQVLLAAAFGAAGFSKLSQPIAALAGQMSWTAVVPTWVVRLNGAAELLGALGLLLPSLTRVKPRLTALAALGLVTVMLLAAVFHVSRGEFAMLPPVLVLGALAAFVAWGRGSSAPIASRSH